MQSDIPPLTESLDVSALAERVTEILVPMFRAQSSFAWLRQPDGSLACVAIAGRGGERVTIGDVLPPGVGVAGRAITERRAVWAADGLDHLGGELTDDGRQDGARDGHQAILAVPLVVRNEVIGAIATGHTRAGGFPEEQIDLLQAFADQAALVMRNAQLLARPRADRAEAETASLGRGQFLALLANELRNSLAPVLSSAAHAQRVATLGELSASFVHEITQPLTAIVTNAQAARRLLAASGAEGGELTETLVDIGADAERAAAIVRRLLALVRKQPGERQPVDVNIAITKVTRILRRDIARADVSLLLHLGEDLPPVLGDVVQLQQVVLNLLLNACQAMAGVDDGPRVLRIETAEPEPGSIEITVADSGPGLPEPELERMFEPFVSSKAGGLGMGLSINRSIIGAHGGRIWATRNPDRGLTLHVTLPGMRAGHADPHAPADT